MKKRIFALMLCLAIVFTFAPTLAFAEDTVIDSVPITIADPVAGEHPTYMSDMLEGKNYTVYQEGWSNHTGTSSELKARETFELGKEYVYYVWFKPNEGYSFDYNAVATISNPAWSVVGSHVSSEGMLFFQAKYKVTTGENKVVPDEEKIKETLNLDLGTYNSEPGQTPTYIGETIDCERYYVSYEMWYNITDWKQLTEDETFEAGKLYTYSIYIRPYEEYGFNDDSQVAIDGIEWNQNWMMVSNSEDSKGEFVFWSYYTPGLETIDNITVNIEEPEEGKPLVFVEELPEDANYTISEQYWREDIEPLPQDSIYNGIGSYYYYTIIFSANEGYRFTSNTTVTINGIEWDYLDAGALDAEQPGDCLEAGIFAGYTLREKETEVTTEATTEVTTEATIAEVTTEAKTETITETTAEVTTEATIAEVTTEAKAEVTNETTTVASIDTPVTGDSAKSVFWILLLCTVAGAFVTLLAVGERKQ